MLFKQAVVYLNDIALMLALLLPKLSFQRNQPCHFQLCIINVSMQIFLAQNNTLLGIIRQSNSNHRGFPTIMLDKWNPFFLLFGKVNIEKTRKKQQHLDQLFTFRIVSIQIQPIQFWAWKHIIKVKDSLFTCCSHSLFNPLILTYTLTLNPISWALLCRFALLLALQRQYKSWDGAWASLFRLDWLHQWMCGEKAYLLCGHPMRHNLTLFSNRNSLFL